MNGKWLVGVTLVLFLLGWVMGCENKELSELRTRVGQLENELDSAKRSMAKSNEEMAELRSRIEQNDAAADAATSELVKVKVERDKLKQELAAFKKKKR